MHTLKNLSLIVAASLAIGVAAAAPPADSPYITDPQSSHVEDATSQSIGTVNMIMCYLHATAADQLVNQPTYVAYADQNKCDKNAQSSAANSGASGGSTQAPNYMRAVVNSTRASNADPMRVKIWFEDTSDSQKRLIYVNVSATQAPSATNPYGVFRLDFCGHGDPAQPCMMQGYVEGKADGSLTYFQNEAAHGNGGGPSTTALKLAPNGTDSGAGDILRADGGSSSTFSFAYDPNYFLRSDGSASQCFSRDAADPATGLSVWRYGLYDPTTGARVDRNSGFPISFTAGGNTYSGYLSYWGLSLPHDAAAALTNGATISKVVYGSGSATTTSYTAVLGAGKLTKYTKQVRTLQSLDQIHFNVWVGSNADSFFPSAARNTNYDVYWDETSQKIVVAGYMNCGNNGCQTHSFDPGSEQSVDLSFWSAENGIAGWSSSLGGELFIDLHGQALPVTSASVNVVYRTQNLVYPNEMPATLYCVRDCPTAASMAAYFANGSVSASPFTDATFNNWNPTAAANVVAYTADGANAVLDDAAGQAVTFTDGSLLASRPQYSNGLRTGRLVDTLSVAECAPGTGQYCDFQVQNADTYYVWETGADSWNHFAAAKDPSTGAFVKFDPPLNVNFAVPADGTRYGSYSGKTLVLQYGGFGQLWGIPGECVMPADNSTVSCDTQGARFVPAFAIPMDLSTGVVTASVAGASTSYLVKWLDREIRFAPKAASVCAADSLVLPAAGSLTLPTSADLLDPSDAASSAYIGTEPTVSDPVRVIQGEIKW
jgi:hypothetical protein